MKLAGLLGPWAVVGALLLGGCDSGGKTEYITPAGVQDGGGGGGTEYVTFGGAKLDPTCSYVVDELAVRFTDDAPPEEVLNVLSRYDAHRIMEDRDLGGAWIVEVDPDDREGLRRALDGRAGVESVETVGFNIDPGPDPERFNQCGTPIGQSEVP